jgi:enoyl-CoA hydratase/carnithine racemase
VNGLLATLARVNIDELRAAGLAYDVKGAVATVTLDRPEVRNAQTPLMWRTLAAIGSQIPDEVRVVVVTGSGQSFSAGLDRAMLDPASGPGDTRVETVAGLLAKPDEEVSATIAEFQQGFTWLRDPRFVSIAVVQGYAIGAGFQLALSCDLRVLADDAQLSMKEAALGLVPDLTGTQPLVAAIGYARALEICATSRLVSAEEAMGIGLANLVGSWSVSRARDAAWQQALVLWELRDSPTLTRTYLESLASSVGLVSRQLLVPVA